MEQRRLRPGDRLDDYCPRERRVSDHVVVAVVDDTIKQTRCVACDAEHPFKGGQAPPRRKVKEAAVLVQPSAAPEAAEPIALDEAADPEPLPNLVVRPEKKPAKGKRAAAPAAAPAPPVPMAAADTKATEEPEGEVSGEAPAEDDGPVHRRLIRATLPRPEGQVPVRPLPDFTIRQPGSRGGFGRNGSSQRPPNGKSGHRSGPWSGASNGQGASHRPGMSANEPGGGRGRHWSGRPKNANTQHKKSR